MSTHRKQQSASPSVVATSWLERRLFALFKTAHHERYDGKGYPLGLKAEAIPPEARLFAVVDVFDALTSSRAYKPAYGIEQALAIMAEGRGSHFDPVMFDLFEQLAPTFVARLPEDKASLTQLLMDRLLPYLDRFVPLVPEAMDVCTNCFF